MADLKGDLLNTFDLNYGMKSGYNVGTDVKFGFGSRRRFRLVLGLTYNSFKNTSDTVITPGVGFKKAKFHIFDVSLGAEYAFLPKYLVDPFLGVDITGNFFSGSADYDNPDLDHQNSTLSPTSRFGLSIGGGIDIVPVKGIGVGGVAGIKFNMANLIGKKTETAASNSGTFSLNDESKNISYVSFYLGLTVYLDRLKNKK
jgi:hypothetical protein